MLNVLVIPANCEQPIEQRTIRGLLTEYQAIVGGYIEATDIPALRASLFSNEEGLLVGLPYNERATSLLWTYSPEHIFWTVLVGDIVVVGMPDNIGNTTNVPAAVVTIMEQAERAECS